MMQAKQVFFVFFVLFSTSCSLLKTNSYSDLENGRYKSSAQGLSKTFWVQFGDSIIQLYSLKSRFLADKNSPVLFSFEEIKTDGSSPFLKLSRSSFDVDLISIPFKYRPSVKLFPNQLNTNFSGAVYAGIRKDFYHFYYRGNPIGEKRRVLKKFGLGCGLFSGLGSVAINQWTTENAISPEYDGFVFMNGFACIVAVSKLTFGLGVGTDFLLDRNKKNWIYQQKPWVGVTVGLNLN